MLRDVIKAKTEDDAFELAVALFGTDDVGVLGSQLRTLKKETGLGLGDLTVLSTSNDPFRLDTPTFHEAGQWLRDRMQEAGLLDRVNPIHNRGLFYAIVARGGVQLPRTLRQYEGKGANRRLVHETTTFVNDESCWNWLETVASKAARWLGYVDFERIIDARNAAPVVRLASESEHRAVLRVATEIDLPEDLTPQVELEGFMPRQPYHLVFWGEKTSLEEVLGPLANHYKACLFLPSGEISDTMLAQMARNGERDGRPMVVFVFADCDPAGYQMAVSIGHKLRALREAFHPSLAFKVVAAALTVEQVKQLDLPSTPLKATELRAAGWKEKHGVEQTEIDALATLRPDVLRQIVRKAVEPYWDASLESRARQARYDWEAAAQEAFEAQLDPERMAELRGQAEEALDVARAKLADLNLATEDLAVEWPEIETPEPTCSGNGPGLVDSDMDLAEAIAVLRERKKY